MHRARVTALSIALTGDEPPSEFRIFAAGKVETSKGDFLFDDKAARLVMADYATQGNELMVDYDHASLAGLTLDPAQSGKAAGWFNIELRMGELWAVNVRWTEPAHAALARKEWRYMSPAFNTEEGGRITSLLNVALTNIPATRKLQPLMAANAKEMLSMLSPETIKKALEAIKNGDSDAAMSLLEEMIASAAGGESTAEEPAPEAAAETTPPEEEKVEEAAAVAASISTLTRLTSKTTLTEAVAEVEVWRASHLKLEAETQKLAKERAALELGQRKENAKKLIAIGAETQHTSGLAKGKLVKRLLEEPLDEQNERVAALLSARGGKLPPDIKPPTCGGGSEPPAAGSKVFETPHGPVTLSARELKTCEETGAKPEVYAANKAIQLSARKRA